MGFSTSFFIFVFLPLVLVIYFCVKDKYKNYVLLVFSLIFYGFAGPKLLLLLISMVFIDYISGIMLGKLEKEKQRKICLIMSIIINVAILIYFKYAGYLVETINSLFKNNISIPNIVLPVGISFYTFQAMSYVIDVYKNRVRANKSFIEVLLYISMFPQLVAGPIIRYSEIEQSLHERHTTFEMFVNGLIRFIFGLAKKVLIADMIGRFVEVTYGDLVTVTTWINTIAFTLQIYLDFSAYSDMAIGLGQIFGFEFSENFNYPYIATSVTDFWRRWHISLSSWFRDYVYIPLGGNKEGKIRQIINLFIVWSLTGLWHGSNTVFLIWGIYNCVFLILEKLFLGKVLNKLPKFIGNIYMLFVTVIGMTIFNSTNVINCIERFKVMFSNVIYNSTWGRVQNYLDGYIVYLIIAIIISTPIIKIMKERLLDGKYKENIKVKIGYYSLTLAIFILCICYISQAVYNPFIYFRF